MALSNVDITPQLVQAVRDAIDIVEIAGEQTRLKRSGKRYSGRCPLHKEKTPSFSVDPSQGLFYCFGCGRGGDAIKLHMMLSGDDFPAAIQTLARRYGIPMPKRKVSRGASDRQEESCEAQLEAAAEFFAKELEKSPRAQRYLHDRKVEAKMIESFEIGYAPDEWQALVSSLTPQFSIRELETACLVGKSERSKGRPYDYFRDRLMFPIRTPAGRLVGFGGRTLGGDRAKYLNTGERQEFQKRYLLYGMHVAKRSIRESGTALVVEGYFDVIGAVASGLEGVVATMGTAMTAEQVRLLGRYADEVVIGYDGDAAGEEASRRSLHLLLEHGLAVRRARFGDGMDPDSLRLEVGAGAVVSAFQEATDSVIEELERLIPSGIQADPQRQSKAAQEVRKLLRPIEDAVLRYSYGKQAADRLGLPLEILWKRDSRQPSPPESVEPASPAASQVQSLEERAIQLLLLPGPEMPDPENLPAEEIFFDADCRNIFRSFSALYRKGAGSVPEAKLVLANIKNEGSTVDRMAKILLQGTVPSSPGDLSQALRMLNRRWQQQRQRELLAAIKSAQRDGDSARLEALLKEKELISSALHQRRHDQT